MSIKVSDDQNTVWVDGKEYVAHDCDECCTCDIKKSCSKAPCNPRERKDNREVIFKLKSEVENELD